MDSFGPARMSRYCVRWLLVVLFAAGTARAQAPPGSGTVAVSSPAASAAVRSRHENAAGIRFTERNGREHHAAGRIIVKYRDTVGAGVAASLAGKDTPRLALGPDAVALDALHRTLRVHAARPLLAPSAAAAAPAAHDPALRPRRLDTVRMRYPARNARAPRGAALTDLEGVLVLSVPAETNIASAVAALQSNPLVEFAQPDFRYAASFTPDDPYFSASGSWGQPYRDLWGLHTVRSGEAWDISRGDGVVVAVVDTGVDYTHPDLGANIWVNPGEIPGNGVDDDANGFVDDTRGWDFAYADNDPTDDFGHGTHVAGIIAATGGNGSGVVGIAYGAKVMPIKGLDADGYGWTSDLAAGIVYAAANGADVINNSWGGGGPTPTDPVLEDAIRLAHGLGAIVVFAAGNEAADLTGYNPQDMPEVIVVAASSERDTPAWFTNRGAALDLAAPGGGDDPSAQAEAFRNILSLAAGVCNPGMCPTELTVAPGYVRQAGTSMAAPFVSGAAALLIAAHPERLNEQVRQALRRGSVDLGNPGFDATWGYGRLDAAAALAEDAPAALLTRPRAGEILAAAGSCEVRGIADGVPLASWTLEVGAGAVPAAWTTLASSDARVGWDGVLGAWDTGQAADGTHTLRLTARNGAGRLFEDRVPVTVENVRISHPAAGKEAIIRGGSLVQIEGTAAPLGFSRYAVSIASSHGLSVAGEAIRLPGSGLEPVRNGLLATWDTTGLPPDHYLVELAVTLAGGETRRLTRSVIVDPTLHSGWPLAIDESASEGRYILTLADHLNSADLDGDGAAELVIGYGSQIDVFKGDASHLPGWPQSIDPAGNGGGTQWGAAIGDVDGDGKLEVVASSWDQDVGRLFVWRSDGTALPGWPLILGASPLFLYLWDFEGDGSSEIIAIDWDGNVNVFDAHGRSLPGWPRALPLWSWRGATGDVDGDHRPEIAVTGVVEDGSSRMYLLGANGLTLPGWPVVIPTEQMGGTNPALGDLDNDGDLEIVLAASFSGEIHAYHHDGAAVEGWPASVDARGANPPTIGDLDGDGKVEVIAGSFVNPGAPSQLFAMRGDGSSLPGWPIPADRLVEELTYPVDAQCGWRFFGFGAAALADINGDGAQEAILSSDAGCPVFALHALDALGREADGFPKPTTSIGADDSNTAAVDDFDGDGLLELAWVDFGTRIWLWDLAAPRTARADWPMFGRTAGHSFSQPVATDHPPVAVGQSVTITAGRASGITLVATDIDRDPLVFTVVTNPANGSLSGTAPDLIYTPAGNYSGPDSLTFKASDGINDSNTATVSIMVIADTIRPTGSIRINSGAASTNSLAVLLNLSAADTGGSGLASMRFRNSSVDSYSAWEPYETTKPWTLMSELGTKKVYAQFMDYAGNLSDANPSAPGAQGYVDAIELVDKTAPTGSVKINNGAVKTGSTTVTLNLSASDAGGSGLGSMRFRNNAADPYSAWEPYQTTKTWTLTSGAGTKKVYVVFKDIAGNLSDANLVATGAQPYQDAIQYTGP